MNYIIKNREPADALRYFEELSAIPRGSRNEKAAAEYLMRFAEEQGLWAKMDNLYNVYIKKPGSAGCENLPAVMLQGHTDMVCEKNKDVEHDFEKDPLKLVLDGDILKASGTTLGADNGVAVAYMMALLSRKDIVHPPLECIFTSQEEIGLNGAAVIDPALITARRMINLDCGPEGECIAGAAGGQGMELYKTGKRVDVKGEVLALRVRGLFGGHSGGDIDKERGNANKIIARLLYNIAKETSVNIISLEGGSKENAICRECDAVIAVGDAAKAAEIAKRIGSQIKSELQFSDAGFELICEKANADRGMFDDKFSDEMIKMLYLLPYGVVAKSMAIKDLVVTSCNMAVFITTDEEIRIIYSLRSSVDSLLADTADRVEETAKLFGAQVDKTNCYPSWEFVAQSELRDYCMAAYKETTGKEMNVRAVHGGLECGIFKSKVPDMDIVGMGPNASNAHTPDEQLDLNSFERLFNFLVKLLEMMTK